MIFYPIKLLNSSTPDIVLLLILLLLLLLLLLLFLSVAARGLLVPLYYYPDEADEINAHTFTFSTIIPWVLSNFPLWRKR